VRRLLGSPLVQRLNLGPMATTHVAFDQPHEGNLFEHLYVRRALQQSDRPAAAAQAAAPA
jgi:hypothetical protein